MNLERQLRGHLAAAARGLPQPGDALAQVIRRGRRRRTAQRAVTALGVLVLVVAAPLAWRAVEGPDVELSPAAAPTEPDEPAVAKPTPVPTPAPTPTPHATPAPGAPQRQPEPGMDAGLADLLDAPALAYGRDRPLELVDRDGTRTLWSEPVDAALPDGRGGVVLQPAGAARAVWLPDAEAERQVLLAESDGILELRGFLPDGRLLHATRPEEALADDAEEALLAVELSAGAQPEVLATSSAYESWTVGPVFTADGEPVHASCHLLCSLRSGFPGTAEGGEPLYHGGGTEAPSAAIDGLTATPDGMVLAFVEHTPAVPAGEGGGADLVLLAGTSFGELGRVPLPWEPGEAAGTPTVSLSADGQRVLVTLGSSGAAPGTAPPTTPHLVEGALTGEPRLHVLDARGVLRWADPVTAAGSGGPVTAGERDTAERLRAFAARPGPDTFAELPLAAEVVLGLGSRRIGAPRAAAELADPAAWRLDPGGLHRARVGPFPALELLAGAEDVVVTGGPHRHCAGVPVPPPEELAQLRRISIQPTASQSCLDWFTVDLFLGDAGAIAGVTLDVWEP